MERVNDQNLIERLNTWMKESISIKLMSIGMLILILLIPSSWITGIMEERQERASSVMEEVAGKWSGNQTLAGPVLIIPFHKVERVELEKEVVFQEVTDYAFFLPELLNVDGKVFPQVLHRGIFDVAVYESLLSVTAKFKKPDLDALGISPDKMLWSDARVVVGVSDLRGISDSQKLTVGGKPFTPEPTSNVEMLFGNGNRGEGAGNSYQPSVGIEAAMDWKSEADFQSDVLLRLSIKGSNYLHFLPLGKTTEVKLAGPWADPSFDGEFLPATRLVTAQGFEAQWNVLHFNRPFSQQWIGTGKSLTSFDFGARLNIPVDQYQKSIRTAKYGILVIMLSFIALLMVEIIKKIRIHPFQYILVGAALIIYYTLLLSLSEHMGYDLAYLISTISTVSLVVLYTKSFLPDRKVVMSFGALLLLFYAFIFVIIQAQEFSLLIGSIGLFFVVAAFMYLSRSIRWYGELAK